MKKTEVVKGMAHWGMSLTDAIAWWDSIDKKGTSLEGIRALCLVDRYYLLVRVCNRVDMLHPWVYARCREVEKAPDGFIDLWAREHGKSSIITFGGIVQHILQDPEITICIFSHTGTIASDFLRQIKLELEMNEVLKKAFPDILYSDPVKQAKQWSVEGGITVKRKGNMKEATLESSGLVDSQPISKHYKLRVYDDVVTDKSVATPEQTAKTTAAYSLSQSLGTMEGKEWMIGTRYCTVAGTKILMADWTHKNICDVSAGDFVVGWHQPEPGARRMMKASKVVATGMHSAQPVNKYIFDHGRHVTCTEDHRWWRGPHGGGPEYSKLGLPSGARRTKGKQVKGAQMHICELLVPVEKDISRDAGYLAAFFDGEGTTKKNQFHPSGQVCLTQTMHNPELVQECRDVLTRLKFEYKEQWWVHSKVKGREHWKDRCVFSITGGWRERYRFVAQIDPVKKRNIAPTLFGQVCTDHRNLVEIQPAGLRDVYWLETETGNYVADGFCSKNSFGDTYEWVLSRGALKERIYTVTADGSSDGKLVLFTEDQWKERKRKLTDNDIACQYFQNPLQGQQAMFNTDDLRQYEVRPAIMNVYVLCDPARSRKKDSDNTAIIVVGVDYAMNKYLLDGFNHKMNLQERWENFARMWARWKDQPGVQNVHMGYEEYGAQADLDYFKEQMKLPKRPRFEITELAWPREGGGSKIDRVQRLVPDSKDHKIFLPYPSNEKNLTTVQRNMKESGYDFRISKSIKRLDENGNAYDLSVQLRDQFRLFPFGGKKDAIDALSRIYDMVPRAPNFGEPNYVEPDYV